METVTTKVCTVCKVEKPRSAFYPRGDGTMRIQAKCKYCCSQAADYQREWRKKNPEKAQNFELKRRHNITLDDYEVLLEEQHGVCAVCKKPPGTVGTGNKSKGTLAVDHDHLTGAFRGLVCTNCNLGLGSFFDSPKLLMNAALYIQEHQALVKSILERQAKIALVQADFVEVCLEDLTKL